MSSSTTLIDKNQRNEIKDDFFIFSKGLYKNKDFSDKVLFIVEEQLDETGESTREHLKDTTVECGSYLPQKISLPIHSLVFCINSRFFRNLFYDSNMLETKENKFFLHVNHGDIQYVKLVIKSLYNPEIIDNIKTIKLLKVLEYADRYMCDSLLKRGLSIVKNIIVTNVDECSFLLHKIAYFENYLGHLLTKDFFLNVKTYCSQFLAKTFTPLECCAYKKSLIELDFLCFLTFLKSNDEFLFSENSVVACVSNWLEANEAQQTEENIKALLSECRYEYMDVLFLRNSLCYTNPIFSKWSGYLNWYINAVSYPSIENNAAVTSKRTNREKKQKKKEELCYKYELQMKYNANTKSWSSDKSMLYRGCVLQLFIYATNKLVLEMILGKDNQKKGTENFIFQIPVEIEIPKFKFSLENAEPMYYSNSNHRQFFSLQNVEQNSTSYTKNVIFQFSEDNTANISLGYILEYEPNTVQNQNDMTVVTKFSNII